MKLSFSYPLPEPSKSDITEFFVAKIKTTRNCASTMNPCEDGKKNNVENLAFTSVINKPKHMGGINIELNFKRSNGKLKCSLPSEDSQRDPRSAMEVGRDSLNLMSPPTY